MPIRWASSHLCCKITQLNAKNKELEMKIATFEIESLKIVVLATKICIFVSN